MAANDTVLSASPQATPVAPAHHDEDAELRHQTGKRAAVFGLTWVAYASYYFGRKGFSVVKSTLEERHGLGTGTLGAIDTGYLTAYAIGQFVNGALGDRIGSRRLVGLGMIGVAIACTIFGMSSVAWVFFAAFVLNGFFQSSGWPATCKAMGSWFTARERGTVMGVWSTCYQAGGLAATAVATFLFVQFGWRWAFFGPAVLIAAVGIINFLFLPERQPEKRPPAPPGPDAAPPAESSPPPTVARHPLDYEATHTSPVLFRSPVLWSLGASYFCLKLIRYSILFWLPYYLNKVLHYTPAQAGYHSISFEVGGIIGSIIIGFISDRWFPGQRRKIAAIMVAGLAGALLLYTHLAPISGALNFLGMALVGFCLFGPDTLICGAAAQDLGGKRDVAKAAGFINGMGSIGAIFQGMVTSGVSARFGWDALFYTFVALALLSCVALLLGKRPAASHHG